MQGVFYWAAKHKIVESRRWTNIPPPAWFGGKDDVTQEDSKTTSKKVVEEVTEVDEKSLSSSQLMKSSIWTMFSLHQRAVRLRETHFIVLRFTSIQMQSCIIFSERR